MDEPHTSHFLRSLGSGNTCVDYYCPRIYVYIYVCIYMCYQRARTILYTRKRIIQICSGGMSISLAITVIIISVNWIAIFRYIRAYIENYMALSSRIWPRRREIVLSFVSSFAHSGHLSSISSLLSLFFLFSLSSIFFFFHPRYNYTVSGIASVKKRRNKWERD